MTLADYLTILRLVLVPFFLLSFIQGNTMQAFVLFAIAGGTDLVDGTIARLLKRQTKIGAFLDPIADKALMAAAFTCLFILKVFPIWYFLLVVGRDALILLGLGLFKFKKIDVQLVPVLSSKLATLFNIITVVFGFLSYLYPNAFFLKQPLSVWFQVSMTIAAFLVIMSSVQYSWAGWRIWRGPNTK
ncbi:MAG: hypothetical protein A2W61_00350 [Deltaproteobacteria bacterium RIFCSPLOWO2_01_44_7]|nr:MAG: hypothetical protein A2712_04680 [Deltaproteobacteria bacterium RIFCSPHIGHO2_01_FULL_43_49]OGQ16475.1 MAG: hypothetical protein A3D22_02645 [Deltaproteobacteria bacterium RIFCSPHIGHO2_02_FULL_44_53]OGQ27697.1 MAG: hypothetical protein A3D98_08340 [Deltaproteobacteria bacterium RIFCSPHIGHO2_12_FULL_44_21]OGQ32993.1 MAG: hypothetical protein A2979_10575 [Deltaproteobacteria bacterium RIFCSPLOWO2_01_FULL_45_74]OGQ42094.1 MAG: hypothetical protein A3I70_10365 [Deltaproteobacteria bacterium 